MAIKSKLKISGFAITLAVTLIVGVVAILPTILPVRHVYSVNSCIAILKQIGGAKDMWALEHQKLSTDIPTEAELFGPNLYIREKPGCPNRGTYVIGAVKDKPTCSIPWHTL